MALVDTARETDGTFRLLFGDGRRRDFGQKIFNFRLGKYLGHNRDVSRKTDRERRLQGDYYTMRFGCSTNFYQVVIA